MAGLDDVTPGNEVLLQLIDPQQLPSPSALKFTPKLHHEPRGFALHPPYFIIFISVVEVCVFLWGGSSAQRLLVYDPNHRDQAWRFLTYMLLHDGTLHLSLNVVIQCVLATPLECEQGPLRTALVYLGGGLAGSLGTSMLESDLSVVGASAGVYALLISHPANILLNLHSLCYKRYRVVAVAVIALADVVFSLYHHFLLGNESPRIGWAAHCCGAVTGLLLGLVLFKATDKQHSPSPWVQATVWTAGALLAAGVLAAVICNIRFSQTIKTD